MLEFEFSADEAKKWDSKVNKEDVKVWIKKGGSKFEKTQPYLRS